MHGLESRLSSNSWTVRMLNTLAGRLSVSCLVCWLLASPLLAQDLLNGDLEDPHTVGPVPHWSWTWSSTGTGTLQATTLHASSDPADVFCGAQSLMKKR